jgi:hypothetical protein
VKGSFEGEAIRDVMIRTYGREVIGGGAPVASHEGLRVVIERAIRVAGYVSGPWLWKGSALYYPAWHEFRPKVVVCRRDPEASFRSAMQPPPVYPRHAPVREIIAAHNVELDKLVDAGAHEVDTQAVAQGDFSTIRVAIEGCGLVFDERATSEFVDPSMWHHVA